MSALRLVVVLSALLGSCAAQGSEPFSYVPPLSSLTAAPHTAAELERFATYRGPGSSEQVRAAWRDEFLTGRLNRAFAASPNHYAYTKGLLSADEAAAGAMQGCERARAGTTDPACTLYAVNTEIVDPQAAYTLPFRGQVLGPFRPSPEYTYHGPASAKGVVVWSHGTGRGCAENGAHYAAPSVITIANQAGWDVLRFDRDPCSDELADALRRMPAGVVAAKRAGYRKIVLAGQSRGAMQSFDLLRDPAMAADISAVIGFLPAISGNDARASTMEPQRWAAAAAALNGTMPVAVFFFDHDDFNPYARQQVEITRSLWRSRVPNGHAYFNDDPAMVGGNGHAAALGPTFTDKYAGCLLALIDRGEASGPCAE